MEYLMPGGPPGALVLRWAARTETEPTEYTYLNLVEWAPCYGAKCAHRLTVARCLSAPGHQHAVPRGYPRGTSLGVRGAFWWRTSIAVGYTSAGQHATALYKRYGTCGANVRTLRQWKSERVHLQLLGYGDGADGTTTTATYVRTPEQRDRTQGQGRTSGCSAGATLYANLDAISTKLDSWDNKCYGGQQGVNLVAQGSRSVDPTLAPGQHWPNGSSRVENAFDKAITCKFYDGI